ncbi:MAG TPA: hypothetical protein VGG16_28140 [Streptosporangiaceae bacterium]
MALIAATASARPLVPVSHSPSGPAQIVRPTAKPLKPGAGAAIATQRSTASASAPRPSTRQRPLPVAAASEANSAVDGWPSTFQNAGDRPAWRSSPIASLVRPGLTWWSNSVPSCDGVGGTSSSSMSGVPRAFSHAARRSRPARLRALPAGSPEGL